MSKSSDIKELQGNYRRLRLALLYPGLAGEEGFDRLAEYIHEIESVQTDLSRLMDHLGLEFEEGKRIIKKKKEKK